MTNLANHINQYLSSKTAYRIAMSLILCTVVVLYLLSFHIKYNNEVQARKDASGFEHRYAQKFFYYYYYTHHFPLATLDSNLVYSKKAAYQSLDTKGHNLIMEYMHWSRLGEHARLFCYYPNAIIKGSPESPSLRLFNAIFLLLGLWSVFRGFYLIKQPLVGCCICIAVLCTPFFHYEVFRNENIFALQACVFFIVLGLLLPYFFLERKDKTKFWLSLIVSAVLIGFCSEIRNEISVLMLTLFLIILLSDVVSLKLKILCIACSFMFYTFTKKGLKYYFDKNFKQTEKLVKEKGGHVYTGKKIEGHNIWHPVFCGLGDYDTRFGYEWNDIVAYRYATPILNTKYNLNILYSDKYHTDNYYDSAKLYYIKFDEIKEYEEVMKDKVISDITSYPVWYMQILLKRTNKILTTTLPFPYLGFVALALLLYSVYRRKYFYFKLLLISLPLSITCFVIYSGKGATYNSMFGYMALAILATEIFSYIKIKKLNP